MKQSRMEEILRDYTAGKLDAQQANQELKKMGAPVRLQPERNEITEAEQQRKDTDCWIPVPVPWKRYMCTGGVWSMLSIRCSRTERSICWRMCSLAESGIRFRAIC